MLNQSGVVMPLHSTTKDCLCGQSFGQNWFMISPSAQPTRTSVPAVLVVQTLLHRIDRAVASRAGICANSAQPCLRPRASRWQASRRQRTASTVGPSLRLRILTVAQGCAEGMRLAELPISCG
jgi:hypothetical protein